MGYDVVFGNLAILQLPPQFQQEGNPDSACLLSNAPGYCVNGAAVGPPAAGGFLASGAIPTTPIPPVTVEDAEGAATGSYIVDTVNPVTYTWSLSLQHEFAKDWLHEPVLLGHVGCAYRYRFATMAVCPFPRTVPFPRTLAILRSRPMPPAPSAWPTF